MATSPGWHLLPAPSALRPPKHTEAPHSSKKLFLSFLNNVKMPREGLNQTPLQGPGWGGEGETRDGGSRSPKPAAPSEAGEGEEGPPLCRGAPGPKKSSSVPRRWLSREGEGLPASFGTEGVGGIRGAVRGAEGQGARASRLAHGGGQRGPSLKDLPRGGVCGGGSGSVVHRGFYSQPLFWGRRGVVSLGSQFSTGPDNKGCRERKRIAGSFRGRAKPSLWLTGPPPAGSLPVLTWPLPSLAQLQSAASSLCLLGFKLSPTPGPLHLWFPLHRTPVLSPP